MKNIEQRCARLSQSVGLLRAVDIALPRLVTWANEQKKGFAEGTIQVDLAYLRAAFRYARKAKLIGAAAIPDFPSIKVDNARQGFYDFRRTRVRDLVNAGVPKKVAMEWTGHQTREVFDRYHIVTAEDQRRALAAVDTKARRPGNVVSITSATHSRGDRTANAR